MFKHLQDKDLNYLEHAKGALSMALTTIKATGAILAHTIYPDVLQDTATEMLYEKLREIRKMKDSSTQTEEESKPEEESKEE